MSSKAQDDGNGSLKSQLLDWRLLAGVVNHSGSK
jgi:hypothetical protein